MRPLTTFIHSISRVESYQHFLKSTFRNALLYLLLLTLVFAGVASIKDTIGLSTGIDEMIEEFAREVPEFELKNGILSVDAQMPVIIEETPNRIFIIDTSGSLDKSVLDDYDEGVFISQNDYTHKTDYEIQTYKFSALSTVHITKSDAQSWLPYLKWLNVFIFVFGFIFFFFGKLISAFIVSILGLFLEFMARYKIGFANLYKLSIYALTLSMVLQLLFRLANFEFPNVGIIYYGLPLFYLWKTLEYLRSQENQKNDELNKP
ncbi:MAG: DUF1189 domain-containing protein [Firmicutes bacterium]|nr:DUF1189 domain-containing protein [Bacillota bacterium]